MNMDNIEEAAEAHYEAMYAAQEDEEDDDTEEPMTREQWLYDNLYYED